MKCRSVKFSTVFLLFSRVTFSPILRSQESQVIVPRSNEAHAVVCIKPSAKDNELLLNGRPLSWKLNRCKWMAYRCSEAMNRTEPEVKMEQASKNNPIVLYLYNMLHSAPDLQFN